MNTIVNLLLAAAAAVGAYFALQYGTATDVRDGAISVILFLGFAAGFLGFLKEAVFSFLEGESRAGHID